MGIDPHANTTHFTLDQLCQRAGVTVRTVRYYIAEGLLPPPSGQGPAARYGHSHLHRLLAIAQLKAQYLPLREIRRVLDNLDEHGIAALATRGPAILEEPLADEPALQSPAATYIASLLDQSAPAPRVLSRAPAAEPEPEKTWRRLPITDDAELLIEASVYDRRHEQIESLIAWAKRLLAGS